MKTPELKTIEQITEAFIEAGKDMADATRIADATAFQVAAVNAGFESEFAVILSKTIAGTLNADETIAALNEFMSASVEEDSEDESDDKADKADEGKALYK